MGQMGSKTFHELHDEDFPEAGTPKRCMVLSEDPRSPTIGLDRTPITVAATPSPAPESNSNEASGTLHDPRSPTYGIDRTPIYTTRPEITEEKKESLLAQVMPSRQLFDNDYETLTNEINENDSLMQEEEEDVEEEEKDEGTSDAESEADAKLLQFHTPMKEPLTSADELVGHGDLTPFVDAAIENEFNSNNTEPTDVAAELADMSENKLSISERTEQKKISKIPVSRTRKSPVNLNSKTEMVSQRSPLAPRNVDSETPKALIQRKQMRNIAMQVKNQSCQSQLVSSGFPRSLQLSDDKENL